MGEWIVKTVALSALLFAPHWTEAKEPLGLIEQRYNQLIKIDDATFGSPDTERIKSLEAAYAKLFEASPVDLRGATNHDLIFLFRAAQRIHFYTHKPKYSEEMKVYLSSMESRSIANDNHRLDYYRSLISERDFADAEWYANTHAIPAKYRALPVRDQEKPLETSPAILEIDTDGKTLGIRQVNVETLHVVVVVTPWCHFARNGVHAIESTPDIAQALEGQAIWLMPVEGDLDIGAVKRWNAEHPKQSMVYAYDKDGWSMLSEWGTPTFYFFKNGHVVAQSVGWRSDEEGVAALRQNLKKIGLLK